MTNITYPALMELGKPALSKRARGLGIDVRSKHTKDDIARAILEVAESMDPTTDETTDETTEAGTDIEPGGVLRTRTHPHPPYSPPRPQDADATKGPSDGNEATPGGLTWDTLEALRRILDHEVATRHEWQRTRTAAYFRYKADDGYTLHDVWKALEADPKVQAAEATYLHARTDRQVALLALTGGQRHWLENTGEWPPSDPTTSDGDPPRRDI